MAYECDKDSFSAYIRFPRTQLVDHLIKIDRYQRPNYKFAIIFSSKRDRYLRHTVTRLFYFPLFGLSGSAPLLLAQQGEVTKQTSSGWNTIACFNAEKYSPSRLKADKYNISIQVM